MRYRCRPPHRFTTWKRQKARVDDHFSERWADFKIKHFAVHRPSITFASREVAPFLREMEMKRESSVSLEQCLLL